MGGRASTIAAPPQPVAAPVQAHLTWAHHVDPAVKEGARQQYCCAALEETPISQSTLTDSPARIVHRAGGSAARTRPAYSCSTSSPGTPTKCTSPAFAREGFSFPPQNGLFLNQQQSLHKKDLVPSSPCVRKEAMLEIQDISGPPHRQFGMGGRDAKKAVSEQHRTQFSQQWRNGEYSSVKEWSGKVPDYQNRSEKHLQEVAKRLSHEEVQRVDRGLRAGVLASVRSFDNSGDGRLSPRTLSRAISSTLPTLSQEDIAELLCDARVDGSGRIEYAAVLEQGLCVEAQVAVHVESRAQGQKNALWQNWTNSAEQMHSKGTWAQPLQQVVQESEPVDTSHLERRWSGSQVQAPSSVNRGLYRLSPVGHSIGRLPPSPLHMAQCQAEAGALSPQSPWSDMGSMGGPRSPPLQGKRSSSFTFSEKRSPQCAALASTGRTTVGHVGAGKRVPAIRFPEMPAATRNVPLSCSSPAGIGRLRLNADGDVCLSAVKRLTVES